MRDTLTRELGALAILLGLVSLTLLAVAVWGFRTGGWPWLRAYDLAGWGAWAAGAGILVAVAGLVEWAAPPARWSRRRPLGVGPVAARRGHRRGLRDRRAYDAAD